MTPQLPEGWPETENIQVIRESIAALRLSERDAGLVFYRRLFEMAPSVRPLFPATLDDQAEKLFKTLKVLVASLERLDSVAPVLYELGKKHVAYGARSEHYVAVGSALMWTLREALGEAFTPQVEEDWLRLFTLATREMLRGAEEASLAQA